MRGLGPVGLGGLGHLPDAVGLMVVGLDHIPAVVVLLHHAGEDGDGLLSLGGAGQVPAGHNVGDADADDHEHQENAGEGQAVAEHDDQGADDGAHGHNQLEQAGLEHLGDLVQIAGDPAEDLAGLVLVEEAQGQAVELLRHLATQGEHQALGHAGHQIGLEVVEQPGEQVLDGELGHFPAQAAGEGEGRPLPPAGLDGRPQVVDDNGAVHGVPDGQGHIDDDGYGHHPQAEPLPFQIGKQAYHGARPLLNLGAHASWASFVWDS